MIPPPAALRAVAAGVLLGLALATATVALGILTGRYPIDDRFLPKYARHWGLVATHGFAAIVALLLGAWQLATRHPGVLHRAHPSQGRIYAVAVVVAATTAIPMGRMAHGGPVAQAGMTINALLRLATLAPAVVFAVHRDFPRHRVWMLRNSALTFSAVVLRLLVQLGERAGLDYDAVYPVASWLNRILPLALVEFHLRRPGLPARGTGLHLPEAS